MFHTGSERWMRAGFDAWMLGLEASSVVGLRLIALAAGGGKASREAELMVVEKMRAAAELQAQLMMTPLGLTPIAATTKALKHYRGKVRANRRRLGKKSRA